MVNVCQSTASCSSCGGRHHSLLHLKKVDDDSRTVSVESPSNEDILNKQSTSSEITKFSGTSRTNTTVVLGTERVHVTDRFDQTHDVRVLLDSGSQISAITTECASQLSLIQHKCSTDIVSLAQNPVAKVKGMTDCNFFPHFQSSPTFTCRDIIIIIPTITAPMPATVLPLIIRENYGHF